MRSASEKAYNWQCKHKNVTQREYNIYRDNCFYEVWKPFLDLANQIKTLSPVSYEDPKTTYEARMKAYLVAHDYYCE
jgi:hypothetical protein